jgi:SNF2 family DNA or RNA helicase
MRRLPTQHKSPGALLALDMGVGKSKVAVDLVVNMGFRATLVLCPLSVVGVWPKQFLLHAGREVRVMALDAGSVAKKCKAAQEHWKTCWADKVPGVVVTNYDSAWRSPLAGYLSSVPIECVIYDEAHKLKSAAGRVSQFCWRLSQRIPHRLALTGTPMSHSPLDCFGLYRALDASIFGLNYHAFKAKYAVLGGYEGREVVGFKNEADLNERFYRIAFRAGREVLDLPEATDVTRECTLGREASRVYRQLSDELRADVEKGEITPANGLVRLLRLQQCTSGFCRTDAGLDAFLDTAKADLLAEVVDEIDPADPIIVFCRFVHDLDVIRKTAGLLGRRYGEVSGRCRDGLAPDATLASGIQLAGVQIASGGVGIDLSAARYGIYYSLGFSLADYLQSRARIHRPGQTKPVCYIHLVCERTVDSYVYRRLEKRQEVITNILDVLEVA